MRLCLIIATLGAGGAERVLSTLANWWVARGHAVTLITLSGAGDDFYPLDRRIDRVALNVMGDSRRLHVAIRKNVLRLLALRRAIVDSRPSAVVSFMTTTNVLTLLATIGLGLPAIVSERVDPRRHSVGHAWSLLRSCTYFRANAVVAQTREVSEWMTRRMRLRRCVVIPNPIAPGHPATTLEGSAHRGTEPRRTIAAMGRLIDQKGFDLLIEAFAMTRPRKHAWRLLILGDGPQRGALRRLASMRGIADIVDFAGLVPDPAKLLRHAEIFVLSSRYEGFPNALLEAMALGIACVTADCRSGPTDIVRHGVDGLIVPSENVPALAAAIQSLMDDDALRAGLATRAREVRERFAIDRIGAQWDALLRDASGTPA